MKGSRRLCARAVTACAAGTGPKTHLTSEFRGCGMRSSPVGRCRWPWASACRLISSPRRTNSHLFLDFLPFLQELFDFDLKLLHSHVIAIFLCLFLFRVYLFH